MLKKVAVVSIGVAGFTLAFALTTSSVSAHHAFSAEFDAKQAVRITGALTGIEWTNPHSYFHLAVKNDNETVEEWICEGAAPGGSALSRRGLKKTISAPASRSRSRLSS